jgi:hypothetical protein
LLSLFLIILEDALHTNRSGRESNQTKEASSLQHARSAAGEVHRHFEADTQVSESGFDPHGERPLVVPEDSGESINARRIGEANATFEATLTLH